MTISSYSTIVQAVKDISDKDLDSVDNNIPNFLQQVEAEVYRKVRVPAMETITILTPDSKGYIDIPSDLLEPKTLILDDEDCTELHQKNYSWVRKQAMSGSGAPRWFARRRGQYLIAPVTDTAVELYYYAQPEFLSANNQTNWFSTNFPFMLVNGTLGLLFEFMFDPENAALYRTKFERDIDELQSFSDESEFGHGPQTRNPSSNVILR